MAASVVGCIAAEDREFIELDSFIAGNKHARRFSPSRARLYTDLLLVLKGDAISTFPGSL